MPKTSLRSSKHILFGILLLFATIMLKAQGTGGIRLKKIVVKSDTLSVDTLSLVPGALSLSVNGRLLDTSTFFVRFSESKIIFKKRPADTLIVRYKVFPYLFAETRKHKDSRLLRPDSKGFVNPFSYTAPVADNDIFKMDGLSKSGSISRGVSFGNSQDLSVNSSLNLQLAGKLSNDVDILLAASDQNIPIQPQGNTQNLQEFDKVFIQLSNKTSKLIAGDFILSRPNSYFMNYNKKAQGLAFSTLVRTNTTAKDSADRGYMILSAGAAISKGKFGRQVIEGEEGNQGPYRLRGAENEPFIIILSGSEKVYIDGQLMKRGQEYDYIIDYNTSELTFTARNLITKDKRLVVEFQYSDKNYARSLIYFNDEYIHKDLTLRFNVYSEQDSKNQPLQQPLSSNEIQLMHDIGDTLQKAYYPSADTSAWSNSLVLYRKLDTLAGGIPYKGVYVHTNDPTLPYYFKLNFTDMGAGNGDYILVPPDANGRVLQWVAPVAGVHQGTYAPVTLLITPKKKQMVTFGGDYRFSKNSKLSIETALSYYDQNTFSPYNDNSNTGYAVRINFTNKTMSGTLPADTSKHKMPLPVVKTHADSVKAKQDDLSKLYNASVSAPVPVTVPDPSINSKWIFTKAFNYEYTQQNFSPIERYRSVEFERDWNIGAITSVSDQHIAGADFLLTRNQYGNIGYHVGGFTEGSLYNGLMNSVSGLYSHKGIFIRSEASLLDSKGSLGSSQFLRHKADISKHFKRITIGVREQQERNMLRAPVADSLLTTSFNFFEWQGYVQNADTAKNKYQLSYKNRKDYGALGNAFSPLSNANDMAFSMALMKNKSSDFRTNVTYRQLEVLNPELTTTKPENSLVGRVEYNLRLLKGFLTAGTFYEVGSGLELKKEYSYLLVPAGQGQYTWIDYNGDGIKQLNEFEIALFPDQATYIRVFTPTDQYIKAYTNQFSQSLLIKPAAIWYSKKGLKKTLSYFSEQATYRVDRKTTDNHPEEAYNPFLKSIFDTSLVTLNSSFRNSVFFNQNDPVFGVDYNFQDIRGKSLLTTGFESRVNDFNEVRVRWNMSKIFGLIVTSDDGVKSSSSQYFTSRNYSLTYFQTEPKFTIQPNTKFRLAFNYKYAQKINSPEDGPETVFSNTLGAEVKYNIVSKGSIGAKLSFIEMRYNGSSESPVAYEMLDGLRAGKNATWSVSYQRTLANNIQISITYEGRQSEGTTIVHTGGASVRAFF